MVCCARWRAEDPRDSPRSSSTTSRASCRCQRATPCPTCWRTSSSCGRPLGSSANQELAGSCSASRRLHSSTFTADTALAGRKLQLHDPPELRRRSPVRKRRRRSGPTTLSAGRASEAPPLLLCPDPDAGLADEHIAQLLAFAGHSAATDGRQPSRGSRRCAQSSVRTSGARHCTDDHLPTAVRSGRHRPTLWPSFGSAMPTFIDTSRLKIHSRSAVLLKELAIADGDDPERLPRPRVATRREDSGTCRPAQDRVARGACRPHAVSS